MALFEAMKWQGVVRDLITYNAVISACEKFTQPERALELLGSMKWQVVVPDRITCNALISACEKGEQLQRALDLFESMKWLGIFRTLRVHSTDP